MNSSTDVINRLLAVVLSHVANHHSRRGVRSAENVDDDADTGVETERLASSLEPLHAILADLVRAYSTNMVHRIQHEKCDQNAAQEDSPLSPHQYLQPTCTGSAREREKSHVSSLLTEL